MNSDELDRAIRLLCERFEWHQPVELFIVGGAAGMLTGVLARDRVTTDCDVIDYDPGGAFAAVEILADQIGNELQLPAGMVEQQNRNPNGSDSEWLERSADSR